MHVRHLKRALYIPGLRPAARLVLATLADHANDTTALAYPRRDTLTRQTGLNPQVVQRIIADLIELGYISQAAPAKPGQNRTFRLYPDRWPEPARPRHEDTAPTAESEPSRDDPWQHEPAPLWTRTDPEMVGGFVPPF